MKRITSQFLLSVVAVLFSAFVIIAANPTITLTSLSPSAICSTGNDTLLYSVVVSNIPVNTNVVIYQSTDSTFNPIIGQGDSIGFVIGNAIPKDTVNFSSCIKTLGIFIDACGLNGTEPKNEYIIMTSGNGINVSNLAINYDPANSNSGDNRDNDINTGTNPCGFKIPNAALISNLRVGSCNASNIIPASPTDSIPSNAIILCFTSDSVTNIYNINGLCNLGYPIYVVQSSCARTIGAFTNAPSCSATATTRYRRTIVVDKRQNCQDNFVYDRCGLFNLDGTYAIRQPGTDTARVSNNGIRINAVDSCGGIDYAQLNFSADTTLKFAIPIAYCNSGFHFIKAVLKPNTQPVTVSNTIQFKYICNDVRTTSNTTNICSGQNALIDISSTNPNAVFSWTVSGGANITGASAGSGNQINQTLSYTGTTNSNVTYNITSNDAGCTKTASVNVVVRNCDTCNVSVQIAGNQIICGGTAVTLTANGQFDSVRWNTGANTTSINVIQTGAYSVIAYKNGCSGTSTINVVQVSIDYHLDKKTDAICPGDTAKYVLSSGDIGIPPVDTFYFTQPGRYQVTYQTPSCGLFTDSVIVVQKIINKPTITGNLAICTEQSTILDAGANYDSYTWQPNVETSQTISVNTPGTYTVTVKSGNCSASNSATITRLTPPLAFSLGIDTSFCGSFTKVLTTGNPATVWSTDVTAAQISITAAGTYIGTIRNDCGSVSDTIVIRQNPSPDITLGNDTSFCDGELTLSVKGEQTGESSYLWNTGEQSSSIIVTSLGTYSVVVSNLSGCSDSDVINVTSNCENEIWLPNAFSPTGDGVNDVFYVRGNPLNVVIEKFVIYNRWGNKVFEAGNILPDDITAGWNGYYKGKIEQLEVYGYLVLAKFNNGEKRTLKGNVTLVK